MKDKPISHKNQNTFRFSTFSERISQINIDVIHQIGRTSASPEEANTFFLEAVEKWVDLNYSQDYGSLQKEIGPEIRNLKEIVFRQDEIIEILLKYLKKEESLALDAILELIVALARDLQHDFYPHFPKFFSAILVHLSTKDTELLEKLFTCLAYLFKFLWKYMIKDIENVYRLFSSLLSNENKEHIRVFAVESFAFLIRKIQSKKKLFHIIFEELQKHPEQSSGVGQLFFEVVKGVKEQFHSCAEIVLKLLFELMGDNDLPGNLIEEALCQTILSIAKHTSKKNCLIIQNTFCIGNLRFPDTAVRCSVERLSELMKWCYVCEKDVIKELLKGNPVHLDRILHLFEKWISFRDGALISSEPGIIDTLAELCRGSNLPPFCLKSIANVVACVLLSDCLSLPYDKTTFMIQQIYSCPDEVFIHFNQKMLQYGMFERDVLPHLLSACVKLLEKSDYSKQQAVEILAETIVSLKPAMMCGDDIQGFAKLYICLPSKDASQKMTSLQDYLLGVLAAENVLESNVSLLWAALVCLPHLRCLKEELVSGILNKLASDITLLLLSSEPKGRKEVEQYSFLLCQIYFTYLVICKHSQMDCFTTSVFLQLLKKYPKCVSILRLVDLHCSRNPEAVTVDHLRDLIPCVSSNLASPLHLVRLFTLKILNQFSSCISLENQKFCVFAICLEAEKLPLNVQCYREKLKWLQKLEYQFLEKQFSSECEKDLKEVPIYYLIGMLFVNFRLLWEPSINILETYAHGTTKIFWDIFGNYLQEVTEMCEKNDIEFEKEQKWSSQYFQQCMHTFCISGEKPDIGNHRLLLWKAMEKFPDVAESKNKMIVPLLFRLMINEITKVDDLMANKQSISNDNEDSFYKSDEKKPTKRKCSENPTKSAKRRCLEEDEKNNSDELDSALIPKSKSWTKRKYSVAKTLAAYLVVFSKFKNPKALHRTEELQRLYNELLSYHDPLIQKLSFDCIMTYSYKFLTPYKEHFYRILDNKTFKTEVVLFSLDTQNEVIQEEHRLDVLAVLMRILYGKMLHKTGNNTSGKAQANTRRSLVLRFLAGCTAKELQMFFDLVFMPFQELLKDDTYAAVKKIRESLDMSIVPLRRQHSALNSLGLIFEHLGNLVPELLPWLLKLLLLISATSTTLLEKRDQVLPHCISLLKSIRTLAIKKLIQFLKSFSNYEFHPEEIDALFESIVWPMLPHLEFDSVNQPSPLLRLLTVWSENPRYFVLFSKFGAKASLTPLPHLIALYTSTQAKARVVGGISKIIFNLVTSEDYVKDKEHKAGPLQVNSSLDIQHKDGINYGTQLLLPYMNDILQRLERTVLMIVQRKSKKLLSLRDLTILLRLSQHIENQEQSEKFINLLVPFLYKSKIDSESEVLTLHTISNLIKKVEDPESLLKLFPALFGKLTNPNSRSALICVLMTIAELKMGFSDMANIIQKLNAMDPILLEEPDYQVRLDGCKEALQRIQKMTAASWNNDFIRMVLFNCVFTIRTHDDIALRNSCSKLVQDIVVIISSMQETCPKSCHQLVFDTLLPEIQKGLKSPLEVQRHEFINMLSAVLQSCKNEPPLQDLVALCHSDKDLDFWENLKHLQVHRRARALLRFSDHLKTQRDSKVAVNVHYLLAYMIPIVQSFLFDDAYKKHVHVIDAAIETLGSIASVLPWHHYELLLKQYLELITKDAPHHKTIVKIIVSLLNAFPYNLKDESDREMSDATGKGNGTNQFKLTNTINSAIRKNILPLLHRSLMKKRKHEDEHKLAGPYYPEDEEILRVPIALAMLKLLQKLPLETLEKSLPGLLLKMCELLKSRTESIRETARDTLIKMMQSLGPRYFHFLLKEMRAVMKRGYQVHVMIFTVNSVLTSLASQLASGDLDDSLKDLSELCLSELFSDIAEEKEVAKITGKLKEARTIKSYSIFKVIGKFISETLLTDLILPLKEVIMTKHSHKSVKKVSECLRNIALGLSENSNLSDKGLLEFVHCVTREYIPKLNSQKKQQSVKWECPDSYLLPKEPGRSGPPAKINEKTNSHILIEFGLQILHFCLKKDKISKSELKILEMLDPFVGLLSDCLSSNHVKIISTALRCLLPIYKYPLPAFKNFTQRIVKALFILVNKYAGPGMAQGDNFEMIVMCFKTLMMLVRDTHYHEFEEDQLHSLLSYVEQDIFDVSRQATAFSLLKAILSRRMESSELAGIMCKVAEMSVTSEQEHIRAQCRQLCVQYMLDYPLGKKLGDSIAFFNKQLEYPHEGGRISCLEVINSMITLFPENVLQNHSVMFLLYLSMRLVNDESSQCRKMSAHCIKKLLQKVSHDGRAVLFTIVFQWLQDKKMSLKRVAAQVFGLFAEVEGEQFECHLSEILPVYLDLMNTVANQKVEKEADKRSTDHFLYHLLNSLIKILSFCPVLRKPHYTHLFNKFWDEVLGVVLYPHMWVRLSASQLFGLLFASYSVEEIQNAVLQRDHTVYISSRQKLRDLSADFCTQIQSVYLNDALGEQVIRNLVYLARIIDRLPDSSVDEAQVTLTWMLRKMCTEARKEVTTSPTISITRKYVFMFIAAIAHELGRERLAPHLDILLVPICREMADASKQADASLKKTGQEVLDLIQGVIGVEEFSKHYASIQTSLLRKKMKRKKEKAQEAVTHPEKYAKRKIKKQQSKKDSKKRKILKQKGRKNRKKPKLADVVIAS